MNKIISLQSCSYVRLFIGTALLWANAAAKSYYSHTDEVC